MMVAVRLGPPDHAALEIERADDGEYELQRARGLERAVRKIAVIADGEAKHPPEVGHDEEREERQVEAGEERAEAERIDAHVRNQGLPSQLPQSEQRGRPCATVRFRHKARCIFHLRPASCRSNMLPCGGNVALFLNVTNWAQQIKHRRRRRRPPPGSPTFAAGRRAVKASSDPWNGPSPATP